MKSSLNSVSSDTVLVDRIPLKSKMESSLNTKSSDTVVINRSPQFFTRCKELEIRFKSWISKQPLPAELALVAATSGLQGAAVGAFYGNLAKWPPLKIHFENFGKDPLSQARNFALMMAADATTSCALKRVRGKEDIKSRMAAAFASGFVFQWASAVASSTPVAPSTAVNATLYNASLYGAVFAAWHFLWHKEGLVHQVFKSSKLPVEESRYTKTKCMLSDLGLESYETNFKENLLTDSSLPLLSGSDFKDAGIPIGATVQILDYIKRDLDLPKMQKN